jgi:phage gpG-like protein
MSDGFQFEFKGFESLNKKVEILREGIKDLRPLFKQFSADFYKQEKQIFNLKSKGKYIDLTDRYKKVKTKKWGFVYPILFASGRLASSLLNRGGSESINVITKTGFMIGTKVPYAVFHHSDEQRRVMPQRPVWILNGTNKSLSFRWARILETYMEKMKAGAFK